MIQISINKEAAAYPGRLLAIDTSTAAMSIAILDNGQLVQEAHILADRSHSLYLMPMIKELIQSAGMKLADLSAIAVGVGPGSYTGVRIGVTAAKTLAWTLKLPIIGISSLEAMALGAYMKIGDDKLVDGFNPNQPHWLIPLMDARRAQAYTGLYAAEGGKWQCIAIDSIRIVEHWLALLASKYSAENDQLQPSLVFIGEMTAFSSLLQQFALQSDQIALHREANISAFYIGQLGSQRLAAGDRSDVHRIIPNYTQLTEAEANLLAKPH